MPSRPDLLRRLAAGTALAVAVGLGTLAWASSLLGEYSVMDLRGHGGHAMSASRTAGSASVTELIADPLRPADVRVELVARQSTVEVPGGHPVAGYTVNGTSPGPTIRARQGELVEVGFTNESVAAGATLH
ncbi:MAG: multicopper oxidase domain-containing protein, partial [Pseudarthrobacter sp.]|nr:multicopper oxidase domain-containing protein [Pseudarthrobacter sp.]